MNYSVCYCKIFILISTVSNICAANMGQVHATSCAMKKDNDFTLDWFQCVAGGLHLVQIGCIHVGHSYNFLILT